MVNDKKVASHHANEDDDGVDARRKRKGGHGKDVLRVPDEKCPRLFSKPVNDPNVNLDDTDGRRGGGGTDQP